MSAEDVKNSRHTAVRVSQEEACGKKSHPEETLERSIIIIGSKRVGKTTMIYKFLEKDETPKPTTALDYSFGRKAGKNLVKDIVHVWEVGHVTSSLISAAMIGSAISHSPYHTTIMIMLNLAEPEVLWSVLEESLAVTRSAMKMSYSPESIDSLVSQRTTEMKNCAEKIEIFPMNLCIIGGNYDRFMEFPLDTKQLIGRSLRVIAHSLGAHLQYHSSKDSALVRKTKDLLSHHGFGSHPVRGCCMDYGKPLVISTGNDSFASIDPAFSTMRPTSVVEKIKQAYAVKFPHDSKDEDCSINEDPAGDPNFNETAIDSLRMQRDEEISTLLRDMLERHSSKIPIPEPY